MQNLLRRCTACFFPRRYWCGPTADRHIGTHTHSIQLYTRSYTLHTHWYTPGLICLVVRLAAGELDIGGEINQRQQLPLTHNARPQAGVYIPTTATNRGVYYDNGLKRGCILRQCQQAGSHIPTTASNQVYILAISTNKIVYSDTGVYSYCLLPQATSSRGVYSFNSRPHAGG